MASGLDKLEKFFSKKKAGPTTAPAAEPEPIDVSKGLEQQFPAPSFIRPKSSRMTARDEVLVNVRSPLPSVPALPQARRAQSLPEPPAPSEAPTHSHSASTSRLPDMPESSEAELRQPTILTRRREASVVAASPYQFPDLTIDNDIRPTHSTHSSIQISPRPFPVQTNSTEESAPMVPARVDTPPASDGDEKYMRGMVNAEKQLPAIPVAGNPTPEPTPPLGPVQDDHLPEPVVDAPVSAAHSPKTVKPAKPASSQRTRALRKAASHSSLSQTATEKGKAKILREPSMRDFLSLSDEDIAERYPPASAPPSFALPPTPNRPQTPRRPSTSSSRKGSMLTPSSPLASRPTAAGAYAAQRIAAKYKFDLVYVLSLWPDRNQSQDDSAPTSPRESGASFEGAIVSRQRGITGRLLAAHGLTPNQAPFGVSRAINASILRADGWVEFGKRLGKPQEWSTAYGRSFYTGYTQVGGVRRTSADSTSTASTASTTATSPSRNHNRGIIFAAYRKPSLDGADMRLSAETLRELYTDAEALVEMLIEHQMSHRIRGHATVAPTTVPPTALAPIARAPLPPPAHFNAPPPMAATPMHGDAVHQPIPYWAQRSMDGIGVMF